MYGQASQALLYWGDQDPYLLLSDASRGKVKSEVGSQESGEVVAEVLKAELGDGFNSLTSGRPRSRSKQSKSDIPVRTGLKCRLRVPQSDLGAAGSRAPKRPSPA